MKIDPFDHVVGRREWKQKSKKKASAYIRQKVRGNTRLNLRDSLEEEKEKGRN